MWINSYSFSHYTGKTKKRLRDLSRIIHYVTNRAELELKFSSTQSDNTINLLNEGHIEK